MGFKPICLMHYSRRDALPTELLRQLHTHAYMYNVRMRCIRVYHISIYERVSACTVSILILLSQYQTMLLADLIFNSVHFEHTIPSYSNSDQNLFRTRFTNETLSHSRTSPQLLEEGKGQ